MTGPRPSKAPNRPGKKKMDNGACIRLHYAQQQRDGQNHEEGEESNTKEGTKPSDSRNRMCAAVKKHTDRLPAGETVILVVIPAHGGSKARVAGSASVQEIVAVLTALSKLPGTRRKNLTQLLNYHKEMLADMADEDHDENPDEAEATGCDSEDACAEQQPGGGSEHEADWEGMLQEQEQQQQQPTEISKGTKRSNTEAEQSTRHVRRRGLVRTDGHVPGLSQQQVGQDIGSRCQQPADDCGDMLEAAIDAAVQQVADAERQAAAVDGRAQLADKAAVLAVQQAVTSQDKARGSVGSGTGGQSATASKLALLRSQLLTRTVAVAPGDGKAECVDSRPLSKTSKVLQDAVHRQQSGAAINHAAAAAAAAVAAIADDVQGAEMANDQVAEQMDMATDGAGATRELDEARQKFKELVRGYCSDNIDLGMTKKEAITRIQGDTGWVLDAKERKSVKELVKYWSRALTLWLKKEQKHRRSAAKASKSAKHKQLTAAKVPAASELCEGGDMSQHSADAAAAETAAPSAEKQKKKRSKHSSTAPVLELQQQQPQVGASAATTNPRTQDTSDGPRRPRRAAAAAGVQRVLGQCRDNAMLLELAEAQAHGYDSEDGSIDEEQWQEMQRTSRQRPATDGVNAGHAADKSKRVVALKELKDATAALADAARSNRLTKAVLDAACTAVVGAEAFTESSKQMATEVTKAKNNINTAKLRLQMAPDLA